MGRYAVVGAGIVGLATAREIRRRRPGDEVVVLEKEDAVALHQTSHNSGVVHAGIYYAPGSLKAQLCARGRALLKEYCDGHGIAYVECGKVVVAAGEHELGALRQLEARATANAVPSLRWLEPSALAEVEPHARGVAALHSPRTAIVDFAEVARSLATGIDVRLGFEVTALASSAAGVTIRSAGGEVRADKVVVCAGLQSDRVAALAGDTEGPSIVAFRGEYWQLVAARRGLVRGLIYPVPDPAFPFLGVHFTTRVDGNVDVGPNAVLAFSREGYRRRDISLRDVAATAADPGFRAMARRHWRPGLAEMRGSFSKRAFVAAARKLVPDLKVDDLVRAPAGVRAQAVDRDGSLVDDFRIGGAGRVVTVRNAPSPAATSSLAIAEVVVEHLFG
jgi:L-2-hydroxyglutarate oxidase LhgO